jgi:hypothetical protein
LAALKVACESLGHIKAPFAASAIYSLLHPDVRQGIQVTDFRKRISEEKCSSETT